MSSASDWATLLPMAHVVGLSVVGNMDFRFEAEEKMQLLRDLRSVPLGLR